MKTRAAILYELNKPLRIEEVEIPTLQQGQVLVKVSFTGICHSQMNEIQGKKGEDKFLPHVLGHEGAGIVEDIGPQVSKVKKGDHVVMTWIKAQGANVASTSYLCRERKINSGAISTFSTYSVVSENRLVPIPATMPLDKAALLGCAIPTGAGIIFNTIKPSAESSIAVFGVGGIGLSALLAAASIPCSKIIVVDVHEEKLEFAKKLGAHAVINAKQENPVQKIKEMTNGKGADYAVESAGQRDPMEQAFLAIKDNGGLLVIAGNLAQGEKISIDPFDLIKGKRIIGTWGGETDPDRDIPRYVDRYLQGKLNLDALITHRFNLDDINQAVEIFDQDQSVIRVLIRCA